MARVERELLAVADGPDAARRDAERHEVRLRRDGAALAERQVVFGRAALVAVALDGDRPGGYFLSSAALASSAARASAESSALS